MNETKTGKLIPYLNEMFRYQAWIALGKVASPMTGELERDLEVARQMIDLLSELQTRTEGNRTDDETRVLQGTLTELRLNFMDEVNRPPEPAKEEAKAEEPEAGQSTAGEPSPETAETTEDAKPS